jgi:hypothetical protein
MMLSCKSTHPIQLCITPKTCNRETEKYREKERLAAIDIQKNWRMLKVKWHY